MKSDFLSLNKKDFVRGFIIAVIAAVLTNLYTILQLGKLPTLDELQVALAVGVSAGISYIIKNFVTNSNDEILRKD